MEKEKSYFEELYTINVNDYTEKKEGLTYLSWSYAIAEIMKRYPDMEYYIERFGENKNPYLYDEKLGYMVFTRVRISGQEKEMWLPVMDGKNKAMLDHEYTYTVKKKTWNQTTRQYDYTEEEKSVAPATMFDVNKTIMRCLVKNFAMFGLGLYIYAGEDLPEEEKIETKKETKDDTNYKQALMDKLKELQIDPTAYAKEHKVNGKTTQEEAKALLEELCKQ